ncbi:hypothetical protein [Streptomyces sp. XC 2026]|uniref:hypothetical protein n=1 Tax=Streptomyces sp. XC 2026 TaxID=2782004 RepID=UPI001F2CE93B|nr:hypothetical protein [Streptomyces sp. XC 2026]
MTTSRPRAGNFVGRDADPILPSDVAAAIQLALRQGWSPTAPGPTFHLDRSTGFTPSP